VMLTSSNSSIGIIYDYNKFFDWAFSKGKILKFLFIEF
jgi:hypothetical protein